MPKPPMPPEDFELFRQEMADVEPLSTPGLALSKPRTAPTPGQDYRREAAQREAGLFDENQLPTVFVEPLHPEAILSFKRGGIQNGVFRRLQRGGYDIEAMLDLHGLNVEQARHEVHRFIQDCLRHDVRLALISHGKGRNNKEQRPVLKSFLARWLPMFPEVMAFHSAQRYHGGAGALYLLLRKSERQKHKTREKLGLVSGKPEP
ncbi:DNA-nicking endonuclease, Smr domain [Methylomagnum ishizawai]|uniref:DNA-nicking endonuclease, Smr domain n=2 Tax=Methylomagnum ishizawai TaxID=1760988 RepID=A0A1Y6CTJ1_9GAMM|nr:DNA-nicking endonuclease, Smr domain [Methylomagnum ishizawai]